MLIRVILLVVLLDILILITPFTLDEGIIITDTVTDQITLPVGDLK